MTWARGSRDFIRNLELAEQLDEFLARKPEDMSMLDHYIKGVYLKCLGQGMPADAAFITAQQEGVKMNSPRYIWPYFTEEERRNISRYQARTPQAKFNRSITQLDRVINAILGPLPEVEEVALPDTQIVESGGEFEA